MTNIKRFLTLFLIATLSISAWGVTYTQLTSIASIDESAEYVLGIDGTGFHYSGTSSWGLTALPSAQTPLKYTLTKATGNTSFTASTTIGSTTYYLQIPTSNGWSMTTDEESATAIIIGTTAVSGTNYAVTNSSSTARHIRLNGASGLRSYGNTTGTMAYFYKVTSDCSKKVTISAGGTSHGTFNLSGTGAQETCDGLIITATDITPASGWKFDHIEQSGVAAGNVTINNTAKTVTYAANITGSSTITVVFSEAVSKTFDLVTDASDLEEDAEIVITNSNVTYALSTTQNSNNRGRTNAFTKNGAETTVTVEEGSDVQILTLGKSNSKWTFYDSDADGYLYAASSSNNYLRTQSTNDANGEWTIAISSNIAIVTAQGSNTHNLLQYNSSNGIFSCYGSSQGDIKIFQKSSGPTISTSGTLTTFNYDLGEGPSATQTFSVRGNNLTGDLTVSAPTNYQVSLNGSSWANSQTLTASAGKVASTTIYVRLVADLSVNTYNGDITVSGGGATSKNVAVNGSVTIECTTPTISFTNSTVTKYWEDADFTITPNITGNTLDADVTYSSDKESCATVDENGQVHIVNATGSGIAVRITATLQYKTDGSTCTDEVSAYYDLTIYNRVTWMVNGIEYTTTQVTEGGTISALPDDPDGSLICGGKTFVGWTNAPYAESDDEPGTLFSTVDDMSSVYITENKTYHAVFAESTLSPTSTTYTLVHDFQEDFESGEDYIIENYYSSKDRALNATITGSYYITGTSVTITDGEPFYTSNGRLVWRITTEGTNQVSLYNAETSQYAYLYNSGSYYNLGLRAEKYIWNISYVKEGEYAADFTFKASDYPSYQLAWDNSNSRFAAKTSTQGYIYLYKKTPEYTYRAYSTACCDEVVVPVATVDARSTKATINWINQVGATNGYSLVVKQNETTKFEKNDIPAGTSSWEVTGLDATTTYSYTLTAMGGTCNTAFKGTFTTANCEDVPFNIIVTPALKSATIRWTANASTATIKIYSDAECKDIDQVGADHTGQTSPATISDLEENTTYFVKILADGTCESLPKEFSTNSSSVEIAEWFPDGIRINLEADANASVVIEDKQEHGSSSTSYADSLFFSKYFEATSNTKLLAIFNGTDHTIDLAAYKLAIAQASTSFTQYPFTGMKYKKDGSEHSFTAAQLLLAPGKEIILISYPDNNKSDAAIIKCAQENEKSGFDSYYRLSSNPYLQFNGDDAVGLVNPQGNFIDLIGAGSLSGGADLSAIEATNKSGASGGSFHGFMDKPGGWYTTKGYSAEVDGVETGNYALSTNRCLLIRRNHVKSGLTAVARNENDFVTLGDYTHETVNYEGEWKGVQIPGPGCDDGKCAGVTSACTGFDKVGSYDYNQYYATYEEVAKVDEIGGKRNEDGTYTIPIPQLDTLSCTMMRVKVYEGTTEKASREYKVPIMVEGSHTTKDTIFICDYPTQTRTAETCKECDVVILNGGVLTKASSDEAKDNAEVRNMTIYPGGTLIIPDGAKYEYTVNSIQFRVQGEQTPVAKLKGDLITNDQQVIVSRRIKNDRYYFFSLPYDCNIADIRWSNGEVPVRGTDYQIVEYDAEARAAEGSAKGAPGHWTPVSGAQLKAGVGYNIAVSSQYLKELIFPMALSSTNLTNEEDTKTSNTVTLTQYTGPSSINNHNWNLIAHPYVSAFDAYEDGKITAGWLECVSPKTEEAEAVWKYTDETNVYLTMPSFNAGKITYEQKISSSISKLDPFLAVFVQGAGTGDLTFDQGNRQLTAPARHLAAEAENEDASIFVGVTLSGNGQSDQTNLRIRPDFTDEYQLGYDLQKFTTFYTARPQIYMKPADLQLAFQAVNDEKAKNSFIPMGVYCYTAGTYTFGLSEDYPIDEVAAVYLHDAVTGTTTNLLYDTYTITTTKQLYTNTRFSLNVIVNRKVPEVTTDIDVTKAPNGVVRKLLINGHVYIQRGEDIYDVTGKQLLNR